MRVATYMYITRRTLAGLVTILMVGLIVFVLIRLVPGGPVEVFLEQHSYVDPELREEIEERLGLAGPLHEQLWTWLSRLVRGDFGESLYTGRGVVQEIQYRGPVTLQVGGLSLLLSLAVSVPIGVIAAVFKDRWPDVIARGYAVIGQSVPNFFMAIVIMVIGAQYFDWSPSFNWQGPIENPWGNLQVIWLPVLVLGMFGSSGLIRLTRTQLLEVLGEDYVRTARAKGLTERRVILSHATRNALLPVVTYAGAMVPVFLGGSVVIEQLFRIPGLGQALITAVNQSDYPMIQGFTLMFAVLVVVVNLIVDVSYMFIDPRVRLR